MNLKIIIVIVVLLLGLFIVGIGLGMRSGANTGQGWPTIDLKNDNVFKNLRNWLTKPLDPESIKDDDPGDDCLLQEKVFIVPENGPCEFTIPASTAGTRQLRLLLIQGQTVQIKLEQKNALTVEFTPTLTGSLPMPTPSPLDIYRNQDGEDATLTISNCQGGDGTTGEETPGCRLQIK